MRILSLIDKRDISWAPVNIYKNNDRRGKIHLLHISIKVLLSTKVSDIKSLLSLENWHCLKTIILTNQRTENRYMGKLLNLPYLYFLCIVSITGFRLIFIKIKAPSLQSLLKIKPLSTLSSRIGRKQL